MELGAFRACSFQFHRKRMGYDQAYQHIRTLLLRARLANQNGEKPHSSYQNVSITNRLVSTIRDDNGKHKVQIVGLHSK